MLTGAVLCALRCGDPTSSLPGSASCVRMVSSWAGVRKVLATQEQSGAWLQAASFSHSQTPRAPDLGTARPLHPPGRCCGPHLSAAAAVG